MCIAVVINKTDQLALETVQKTGSKMCKGSKRYTVWMSTAEFEATNSNIQLHQRQYCNNQWLPSTKGNSAKLFCKCAGTRERNNFF